MAILDVWLIGILAFVIGGIIGFSIGFKEKRERGGR
jgi:hypothetical protein